MTSVEALCEILKRTDKKESEYITKCAEIIVKDLASVEILNKLERIITEKLENAKRDYEIKYKESMEFTPIINKSPLANISYSLEFSMLVAEIKGQIDGYVDVLSVIKMLEDKENESKQD